MFLLAVSVASCSKNNDLSNEVELVIASKPMIIEGQNALIVRQLTINNSWHPYYSEILGFQYEEGYEYHLKVRVIDPPLESSKTASYELIKQISKEKKVTIFSSTTFTITNNANAEGKELTSDEITAIKDKIKQLSPFNGVENLTLEFIDFPVTGVLNRSFIYRTQSRTHPEKTGNGNMKIEERDGVLIQIFTFYFDGKGVSYEYVASSPTSILYLILDLTSEYKADYPNLEKAQSGIGLKINL